MLKYPHDRHNGFVQLTDGSGQPYVPDFRRAYSRGSETGDAVAYCGAFMILANRLELTHNPHSKENDDE